VSGVPSNILIENNYFTKRLVWKGQRRGVKNLFELKNAKGVIIRGNTFEHVWVDAQSGWAIMLTPRNQGCKAPFTQVANVLFENNKIIDAPGGINILGYDNICPSMQTTGLVIRSNEVNADYTGFIFQGEIGTLDVHGNQINVPSGKKLLYISNEGSIAVPGGSRSPQYAVYDLIWDNIAPTGYIHSPTVFGTAAFITYTHTYSLVAPTAPDFQAQIDALTARIDALVAYLKGIK
jgi:hypothetical protein